MKLTRRSVLMGATAAGGAFQVALPAGSGKDVVIASANGINAVSRAMEIVKRGGDTLDAVVAGVNLLEDDPNDSSVGYGGLPNEDGVVELDSSLMHGPSRRAGAVGALRNIKNPSKVAKLVMEQTDHIMLVGEGALRFATAQGFKQEDLLTEKSRIAWLVWKRSLRDADGHNNWDEGLDAPSRRGKKGSAALRLEELKAMFPAVGEPTLLWAMEVAMHPPTGTINCLALNAKGEMSGVTTTSGLAWKIPGRVGDSPIIGAGVYVDQDVGGAGSTGRGEENIRVCGANTIVENMRHGMSPTEACLDALKRVSRNYDDDLDRLGQFDLLFYALRKDGVYGSASLWDRPAPAAGRSGAAPARTFSVNDGATARHERCAALYQRK
jgi:N4-(beta-N-acetylglucosaminyl)-L-asparaginase